jgi:hypothetical protein
MNSKDIKKYSLLSSVLSDGRSLEGIVSDITELGTIDFSCAFEVWEYILGKRSGSLDDVTVCALIEGRLFEMFVSLSEGKTRQFFTESLPLNKIVYTLCASSCTGANLRFIAGLVLSTKLTSAEEALRCVRANQNGDFGERMKSVLDEVFALYCERNQTKKPELNKKQSTMLLDFISKIKGPNKNLLTQRIKEL